MRKFSLMLLPILVLPVVVAQPPSIDAQLVGGYNIIIGPVNKMNFTTGGLINIPLDSENVTIIVREISLFVPGHMKYIINNNTIKIEQDGKAVFLNISVYNNLSNYVDTCINHFLKVYRNIQPENATLKVIDNQTIKIQVVSKVHATVLFFIPVTTTVGSEVYVNTTNGNIERIAEVRPWWWMFVTSYAQA